MTRKTILIIFIFALLTACAKKQVVQEDKMQKAEKQRDAAYDTFQKDKALEAK